VNKSLLSASVVALMSGLLSMSAFAAGETKEAAPSQPHKVALIDMAYVFKNYKKFEMLREDLKSKITASEEEAKSLALELQQLQKDMKNFQEGSAEFAAREKTLTQKSLEFETFRKGLQREFLKEESQIYHTVYMEVADAVAKYASFYKYTLVMRFNSEDLETDNPQKLIEGMNRQVVYHRPEDNITLSVCDFLNKKFNTAAAGGAAGAASRTTDAGRKSATK
jgi:outer membrane protein